MDTKRARAMLALALAALTLSACTAPTARSSSTPAREIDEPVCASILAPVGNAVIELDGRKPQPIPTDGLSTVAADLIGAGATACSWAFPASERVDYADRRRPIVVLQLQATPAEARSWLDELEAGGWQPTPNVGVKGLIHAVTRFGSEFAAYTEGMLIYSNDSIGIVQSQVVVAARDAAPVRGCADVLYSGWAAADPGALVPPERLVGIAAQLTEAGGTLCAWQDGTGPILTVQLAMGSDEAASWYRRIGSEGFRPRISEGDGRNWLPALLGREEDTGIHDGNRLNSVVYVDGVLTYSDEASWLSGIPTVNDPYQG